MRASNTLSLKAGCVGPYVHLVSSKRDLYFSKKNTYHSHCSLEFPCTLLASTQLETESPFPAATTARSPYRLPNLTQLSYPSGPYRRHEVTFGTTSLHAPIMACLPGPAPSRHAARRESNGKENTRGARRESAGGRWVPSAPSIRFACLPASASPSASGFSCSLTTTRDRAWTGTRRMRPPTPSGTCSRTRPPPWSVSWPPPLPATASCALLAADFFRRIFLLGFCFAWNWGFGCSFFEGRNWNRGCCSFLVLALKNPGFRRNLFKNFGAYCVVS